MLTLSNLFGGVYFARFHEHIKFANNHQVSSTLEHIPILEYLPNSYNPTSTDKHPVLITLHGAGQVRFFCLSFFFFWSNKHNNIQATQDTSYNINLLLGDGIPKMIQAGTWATPNTAPFIVIAPQKYVLNCLFGC
jgi:hypothetical protein